MQHRPNYGIDRGQEQKDGQAFFITAFLYVIDVQYKSEGHDKTQHVIDNAVDVIMSENEGV